MARPLRIEYPGALYHITSRGNARQDIFLSDRDRILFLKNLERCQKTHNFICHAYCLMDNHFHLVLETLDGNLSIAMRDINGGYTQSFNFRHERVGHLLQGRYKAFIIEKDSYLLEVVRYVVLNPVRARIVSNPKDWQWSNYCATAGYKVTPKWLHTDWTLGCFSDKRQVAQSLYRRFVTAGIDAKSPFHQVTNSVILGDPEFVHGIWERTCGSETVKEIPREQRIVGRPTLEDIFCNYVSLRDRNNAMIFARDRCGYFISEIARHLNLDRSTVGKIYRSHVK